MESERDGIKRARTALRQRYGDLFETVAATLFEVDPIGINFETNTDEYEPEVETILPRLSQAGNVEDVARIIHEEFVRWFGVKEAGPPENYRSVAARIWEAWLAFNRRSGLTP